MSTNSTKTIKGRISNKHGTEQHWLKSVFKQDENGNITNELLDAPFCPLEGELIIYDPDDVYKHPRTKYGAKDSEGNLIPVHLLPFADGGKIYQTKEDENLETEKKTIVDAINEVNEAIDVCI